jgi:hypothetical protein
MDKDIEQDSLTHELMLLVIKTGLKVLKYGKESVISDNFKLLMTGQIKILKEV